MKKIILFLLITIISFSFFSCNNDKEEVIVFDNSEPLALSPNVEWAVINDPYAAYRDECNWESTSSGHCRKGEVLQIKGKASDSKLDVWYLFENGWLPANCLTVYNNRLKAQSVSKKLIGSE